MTDIGNDGKKIRDQLKYWQSLEYKKKRL